MIHKLRYGEDKLPVIQQQRKNSAQDATNLNYDVSHD